MKTNRLVLVLLLFLAACNTNSPMAEKAKILPLGDSITEGFPFTYRYELWKKLIKGGFNFEFVGSKRDRHRYPDYKGHAWEQHHEGHSGWTTGEVLTLLQTTLQSYTPDIALIHLGTNDAGRIGDQNYPDYSVDRIIDELSDIIDLLRLANPSVTVYLAQIIPFGSDEPYTNATIDELNERIAYLATSQNTQASPVVAVDMHTGFSDADLDDGVHPNEQGAEKMAERWAEAILD